MVPHFPPVWSWPRARGPGRSVCGGARISGSCGGRSRGRRLAGRWWILACPSRAAGGAPPACSTRLAIAGAASAGCPVSGSRVVERASSACGGPRACRPPEVARRSDVPRREGAAILGEGLGASLKRSLFRWFPSVPGRPSPARGALAPPRRLTLRPPRRRSRRSRRSEAQAPFTPPAPPSCRRGRAAPRFDRGGAATNRRPRRRAGE